MQRLRNILFVVCLLLLVGDVTLWWTSRRAVSIVAIQVPPDGRAQFIASHQSRLYLAISGYVLDDRHRLWIDGTVGTWETGQELLNGLTSSAKNTAAFGPAGLATGATDIAGGGRWCILWLPQWLPVVLLSIWPARRLRTTIRRWQWRRKGHCVECGYDLRATPERCPECGTVRPLATRGRCWSAIRGLFRCRVVLLFCVVAGVAYVAGRIIAGQQFVNDELVDVDVVPGPMNDELDQFASQTGVRIRVDYRPPVFGGPMRQPLRLNRVRRDLATDLFARDGGIDLTAQMCRVYRVGALLSQVAAFDRKFENSGGVVNGTAADRVNRCLDGHVRDYTTIPLNFVVLVGHRVVVIAPRDSHKRVMEIIAACDHRRVAGDSRQENRAPDLSSRVPAIDADDAYLPDVLGQLSRASGQNLVVDWRAMWRRDATTQYRLHFPVHVPAGRLDDALNTVLSPWAVRMVWRTEENVVVVTSLNHLTQREELRVYDVSNLCFDALDRRAPARNGFVRRLRQYSNEQEIGELFWKKLDDLLQPGDSVTAWQGGAWGNYLAGRLYVVTVAGNHDKVRQWLQQMREAW